LNTQGPLNQQPGVSCTGRGDELPQTDRLLFTDV
jgi:hypothetical protein